MAAQDVLKLQPFGGNVTQAVWAYSSNSGSTYDTIGTESITYDLGSNVTAVSWS